MRRCMLPIVFLFATAVCFAQEKKPVEDETDKLERAIDAAISTVAG